MYIERGIDLISNVFFALSIVTLRLTVLNLIKCGKFSYAMGRNINLKLSFWGKIRVYLEVLWYSFWFNNKEEKQSVDPPTTFMLSSALQKRGNNKTVATNSNYFDADLKDGEQILFSMKSIAWANASVFFALLSLTCKVIDMILKTING